MSDKGQLFRTYKELSKVNSKKQNNAIKNGQKTGTYILLKNIQMANVHIKICSTKLAIREMKIKITVRCYCILSEELKWKIVIPPKVDEGAEKPDNSYFPAGIENGTATLEHVTAASHTYYTIQQLYYLLDMYPKEMKI